MSSRNEIMKKIRRRNRIQRGRVNARMFGEFCRSLKTEQDVKFAEQLNLKGKKFIRFYRDPKNYEGTLWREVVDKFYEDKHLSRTLRKAVDYTNEYYSPHIEPTKQDLFWNDFMKVSKYLEKFSKQYPEYTTLINPIEKRKGKVIVKFEPDTPNILRLDLLIMCTTKTSNPIRNRKIFPRR